MIKAILYERTVAVCVSVDFWKGLGRSEPWGDSHNYIAENWRYVKATNKQTFWDLERKVGKVLIIISNNWVNVSASNQVVSWNPFKYNSSFVAELAAQCCVCHFLLVNKYILPRTISKLS